MAKGNKERGLVNVQLEVEVHTALTILRERYKASKLSDAIKQFIEEHDKALMKDAKRLMAVRQEVSQRTEDDEQ